MSPRGFGLRLARARAERHHHGRASGTSRTEKHGTEIFRAGRRPAYRRAFSEQRDRRDYLPVDAIVHLSVVLSTASARFVPRVRCVLDSDEKRHVRTLTVVALDFRAFSVRGPRRVTECVCVRLFDHDSP